MNIMNRQKMIAIYIFGVTLSFVIIACTSEQPKQTTVTETPTPIYTPQSGRQYECSENGVKPSISGAIYQEGYCFIPISTGKCISIQDQYTRIYSSKQGGWQKCRGEDVVTIPTTGKKYYRFSGGSNPTTFVLN
jgi:hypothetical protein